MVTQTPCEHLEKLLPSPNAGEFFTNPKTGKRARLIYTDLIEVFEEAVEEHKQTMTRDEFDAWVETMPVSRLERILIVSYFYDNLSYKDVAIQNNIPGGATAVGGYITGALARLKKEMSSD